MVSEDIRDIKFSCNPAKCKGRCCVEEGGYGAPLSKQEKRKIAKLLPKVLPLLPALSRKTIEEQGFTETDDSGELCTKTIDKKDCVFVVKDENTGVCLCAFQKLFIQKKSDFLKPVSCYLYPLRVKDYGEFSTLNFDLWDICKQALSDGEKAGRPLYVECKESLIARFGQKWYEQLLQEIEKSNIFASQNTDNNIKKEPTDEDR